MLKTEIITKIKKTEERALNLLNNMQDHFF